MTENTIDFKIILDYLIEKNYNALINYLYDNMDTLIYLIEKTNNPQVYEDFDIYTVIYYLSENKLNKSDLYIMPITINRLIHYLIRKRAYLQLDGNKEIAYQNHYKFYVNIAGSNSKIKLFMLQLLFFYYESLYEYINRRMYFVGIDFEFNDQKIALCQICLFPRKSRKYIWIFDPRELDSLQRKHIIKYIYTPDNIYKILHGSDSLDIPYLFNVFFKKSKKTILKFINRVIDTRFICEYEKIAAKYIDKKCSIYDALKYFGTINEEKYIQLNKITNKMGKTYQIQWNVHNMSKYHIEYALYDVLYLREFLFDILRKSKRDNPSINENLELVPEIARFIFLEKSNVENLLEHLKYQVDFINNYFIVTMQQEYKLNQIYNHIIGLSDDIILLINDLLNINYFKSSLTLLFKYIVYSICTNLYQVYKNKNDLYDDKLNYGLLFDCFDELKMRKIMNLLNSFIKFSKIEISNFIV